jgi:hypothetical protein
MRLLHKSELGFIEFLLSAPEKEFEFKVTDEDRPVLEDEDLVDFIEQLESAGCIKIVSARIGYPGTCDDVFMRRYGELIADGKKDEARHLAALVGVEPLNKTIDFVGSLKELSDIIAEALDGYDGGNDASFRVDLNWNIYLRIRVLADLKEYIERYLDAFEKDELPKLTWKEIGRENISWQYMGREDDYFKQDFYRYKKQREVVLSLIAQKLQFHNPTQIKILKSELPLEHLNFSELVMCLQREGIVKSLEYEFSGDTKGYDLLFSVDEEKVTADRASSTGEKTQGSHGDRPMITSTQKPSLVEEDGVGYFKFYKQGEKIPVGKVGTRKYRLLATLMNPLGVAKTVDSVFEAIRLLKDESDGRLRDDYLSQTRKLERIEFTIKELQKIPGLRGKIRLAITGDKRSLRLIVEN